jgi:hypothetical protein
MNSANQMAEEIYGLHCDIGRLENLVKHWKTEFINEQDYAKMMELEADKAKAENAKLRELMRDMVDYGEGAGNGMANFFADRIRELEVKVD